MTGIILAGGTSKRIGENKAFLRIGEKYCIERVIQKLKAVFNPVLIVTPYPSSYHHLGVRVVQDTLDRKGALGGIFTGLLAAGDRYSFVCGCDMPFLNTILLRAMGDMLRDYDILVPFVEGFSEPLHSIYSKNCLEAIKNHFDRADFKIKSFFPEVRCIYISEYQVRKHDPDLLSFFNLNTSRMLPRAQGLQTLAEA